MATHHFHVILLNGCQIRALNELPRTYQYGIELVIGVKPIRQQRKMLYYAADIDDQQNMDLRAQQADDAFVITTSSPFTSD
jgi:hypothetical protein